jgi:purine-binding chemotaxis protein CheW
MQEPECKQPSTDGSNLAGNYLTFTLGHESYGMPVAQVREIIRYTPITPVPHTQSYVKGVLNLRGKVITVVDLRLKFQLSRAEICGRTCIIVAQITTPAGVRAPIGLIVDAVEAVVDIRLSEIDATPDFGGTLDTDYVLGIAKLSNKIVALLDIDMVATCDPGELHPDAPLTPRIKHAHAA